MPVAQVIMMVESGDGKRALLGRSRGHRPGMLTCLAGFVDQCESVGVLQARSVELRYIGKCAINKGAINTGVVTSYSFASINY